MNKEQIIDEVYENYEKWWEPYIAPVDYDRDGIPYYSKEQFINKCKTDPEFSEKWGLKIEERELSEGERLWICSQRHHIRFETNDGPTWYNPDNPDRDKLKWMTEDQRQLCDSKNIPTKLITITYKNKTIKSYE